MIREKGNERKCAYERSKVSTPNSCPKSTFLNIRAMPDYSVYESNIHLSHSQVLWDFEGFNGPNCYLKFETIHSYQIMFWMYVCFADCCRIFLFCLFLFIHSHWGPGVRPRGRRTKCRFTNWKESIEEPERECVCRRFSHLGRFAVAIWAITVTITATLFVGVHDTVTERRKATLSIEEERGAWSSSSCTDCGMKCGAPAVISMLESNRLSSQVSDRAYSWVNKSETI